MHRLFSLCACGFFIFCKKISEIEVLLEPFPGGCRMFFLYTRGLEKSSSAAPSEKYLFKIKWLEVIF